MLSANTLNPTIDQAEEANPIRSLWLEVQSHLDEQRQELYDEIRHYPPPIPACDQQFNYLLEQRSKINQEWGHVNAILAQDPPDKDAIDLLQEFLHTSMFVDEAVKEYVHALLNE